MQGPFGDLRYSGAAGDKFECLNFPIMAPYLKIKATATGTTLNATFLVTAKVVLNT
jgi:hypothetical protein